MKIVKLKIKNLYKIVSRIANESIKNTESNDILTPLAREMEKCNKICVKNNTWYNVSI